jgi:hypothetical protein
MVSIITAFLPKGSICSIRFIIYKTYKIPGSVSRCDSRLQGDCHISQ